MHVTRSMSLSRFLTSIAALALLAGLLLLPDQAHAQNGPTISGMGSLSFPEGTTTSTVLHTYTATDTDTSTTFTWTLEGVDAGDFMIDAGELKFANVPNFEMPADTASTDQAEGDNVYNVTVKVADNGSTPMSATLPVTVTVTDINEAPRFTTNPLSKGVGENIEISTPIVTYTAADPDASTTFTWTLEGVDAGDFAINPQGELKLLNVPDYESPTDSDNNNVYNVTVRVSDGSLSVTSDFVLNISNLDEPGTVTISGSLSGGSTLTAEVTDIDGAVSGLTWQWARGGNPNGTFLNISGATSATYTTVAADVTKYLQATASYTDPESSGKTAEAVTGQIGAGNSEPTFNQTAVTRAFPENSAPGVSVGDPVTATDSDSDTLTYGLKAGSDSESFTIVPTSGQIQTKSGVTYNFEATKKSYTVHVTVRDSKDAAGDPDTDVDAEFVVTINLMNVNEAPRIVTGTTGAGSFENRLATELLGSYRAEDPDASTTLTWSLEGDDANFFTITKKGETEGELRFRVSPNYEMPEDASRDNMYKVTVRVSDGSLSDTWVSTFSVTNVDEPGTVTIRGTLSGGEQLTAAVTDIDGTVADLRWQWARGSMATGSFANISGETSAEYTTVADDVGQYLRATASYNDPESSPASPKKTASEVTSGPIGASNSEPTFSSSTATRTLPENSAAGVSVVGGTVAATDSDSGDTLTYSLSGTDAGSFEIDSNGQLKTKTGVTHNFDFESTKKTYDVTVSVHDGKDAAGNPDTTTIDDTIDVTITITNVNEAPVITTDSGTFTAFIVDENTETSVVIKTYTATDVDADTTLTWSLEGNDAGDFTITKNAQGDGELKFANVPNFELPDDANTMNDYDIRVKVKDDGIPGNRDASNQLDDTVSVTVDVEDINEAPVITSGPATMNVAENSTTVGSYEASDVDDPDTQTWSVESAADGNFFEINSSGELSFINAPDFEDKQDAGGNNVYNVTVKVTDAGSRSATRDVAVTVTNVNEAPVITTDSETFTAFIVGENTETSVVIKTYTATDVDADTTLTWSLEGNDAGDFSITEDGELKFASVPNFEMAADADDMNDYDITVKVKDDGIPSNRGASNQLDDTVSVTVDVEDINETPVVSGNATPSFEEIEFDVDPADLGPSDYLIGTYTAYDDDGDSVTWDLKGRDSEHFTIDATSGALSFSIIPDYENPVDRTPYNIYEITVTAFDGLDAVIGVGEYTVAVTVTNVDETPEITTTDPTHATPSFAEIEYDATTADLAVADYDARDEEDNQNITWSKAGPDAGDFTIDTNTGVLSFAQRPNFEMPVDGTTPPDNVYNVIVKATDTTSPLKTRELVVTVTVTDVNERPDINEDTVPSYMEIEYDFTGTRPDVHTFSATDYDDGDTVEWTLLGTDADAGDLDIDPMSGVLTFTQNSGLNVGPLPNFEAPQDDNVDGSNTYSITVRATDNHGKFEDYAVVVTVTDVNEVPEFTEPPETAITLDEHDENETYTTPPVADYDARDEEGGVEWSLEGTDSGDFAIDGNGVVTFVSAPNWEDPDDSNGDNVYTFTVVATDILSGASRLTVMTDVTVTVDDVEEAGAVTGDNQNPGVGDTIIFTLTDPDGGIVADPVYNWSVQKRQPEGTWQQLVSYNYLPPWVTYVADEDEVGYEVRAIVLSYADRRGDGKSAESEPTAPVTADPIANAPPRFLGPGPRFVPEGPAGQNVGDPPEVSDRENDTLTFGLTGSDSQYFEIDSSTGQIRTTQELDYETTTTSLYITVTLHDGKGVVGGTGIVTDDDSVDDRKIFDITVTDVEEEGVVTLSQEEPEVGVQLEATLEDGDGDISGESWQWARSENGQIGWINISGATSSSYTPVDTDRGFYLRASVTYTDRRGAGKSAEAFTEQVFGENRRPTFPSTENGQRSIAENTAADQNVGAALTAIDADLDTLTYTLEGADAVFFNIDRVSGQIQTKEGVTYDYEAKTSYALTVRASDGTASATIDVTLNVTNVNEPPDAPAEPSVTATSGSTTSLDVSWTAPTNTGRPAITNYDLRYRQGTTGDFINGPQNVTGTGTSIPGLAEATEYEVQVRASNDEGDSSWSQSGTGTTNTPTGTPHITVSKTALTVTEEDTTGDSYTVVLDTQPTADVTVTVAGHSGTNVTPSPTTLTFTTSNWNTPRTVTVTAGNDADLTNDTVTLTHRAMSADTNYDGITIDDVTVTVNDNDTAAGICGRTDAVRDALMALVPDASGCADVTAAHLAAITGLLDLSGQNITALAAGDFAGLTALTELYLLDNDLTTLPDDVFAGLTALEILDLFNNDLTALPDDVFAGLTALTELYLNNSELTTLPGEVFDGLTALETLSLSDNELTTLPGEVFDGLTALETLSLSHNELTTLPDGVFEPLTSLKALDMSFNTGVPFAPDAVALPDDGTVPVAGGAVTLDGSGSGGPWGTNVTYFWALTTSTSGVTVTFDDDTSATPVVTIPALAEGAELTFTLTVTGRGGTNGIATDTDTATVTVTARPTTPGVRVSKTALTVTEEDTTGDSYTVVLDTQPTADVTVTVAVPAGTDVTPYPTSLTFTTLDWSTAQTVTVTADDDADLTSDTVALTHSAASADANYNGITIDDVTVTVNDNDTAAGICGRTDAVLDALMALIPGVSGCADVTAALLAAFTGPLDLSSQNITALAAGDFAGLTALTELDLSNNDLTTLPDDVFDGLTSLEILDLNNNDLTELPAGVFDRLTSLGILLLDNNELTMLPVGVFDRLTSLEMLWLGNNDLTMLPAGVFDGLTSLETLFLYNNDLTTLPDDVFDDLTALKELDLSGNTEAPFAPDAVALPDEGTVSVAGGTVTLDGSGSGGPWGTNLTYFWALNTTVSGVTFDDDTSATPVVTIPGLPADTELIFTLTVTGRGGTNGIATATDTAKVTATREPGVTVSRTALTVREEDTTGDSYTVVLSTQPTADVTVTVAGHSGTDVTPDPTSLTFTTSNWSTAQEVTVTAAADEDTANDTVTLTHSAASADTNYNGITIGDVTVTVNDNDTGICGRTHEVSDALVALIPGVSDCAAVTAAQLAAITGRLDLSSQNITALAAGDFAGLTELTQLKLSNNKLTTLPEDVFDGLTSLAVLFLSNNELTTLPDGVFEPLTALQFLDLSGNLGAPFAPIADARTDDGTVPVAGGKVRLDGSGSGGAWGTNVTYGWALTTSTSGVTVTFDDDTSATPVVTIPALAEGAELTFTLTVTGRGGSHSIDPATDTANVTATARPTTPGVRVSKTALTVTEEDTTGDSYTVVLSTQPTADVVVMVAGHSGTDVTPSPTTLTFTTSNWSTAQTVTVTAGNDADLTNDTVALTHSAASADANYSGIMIAGVTVTVNDNDDTGAVGICGRTPAVHDALMALVPGASGCADVTAAQLAAITGLLDLSGQNITALAAGDFAGLPALTELGLYNNDLTTLPAGVFDRLTALEILLLDNNDLTMLPAGVFDRLTALTELDLFNNDLAELPAGVFDRLTSLTNLNLNNNDLTELPAGVFDGLTSLEILLLDNNDLTMLPVGVFDRLTSLEMLWLDNNDLTMLPARVFDGLTALETLSLSHNELTTLPDDVFDDLTALKELDLSGNTEAPFAPDAVALPDEGTVPVAGGAVMLDGSGSGGPWGTNVTYFWALNTTASGVTFDDDTSATPVATIPELPADTELIFTLTVTGRGGTNGIATATDTATVTVTARPTTSGVRVSKTALTVTEEDTTGDSYTVVLSAQPTADVTVTVAGHSGTDVTPSPTTLTFTTSNWSTAQTVTVTAGNDADLTNDTVTLTHSAASADANYNGITIDDVTVTVNDNDTAAGICGRTPAVHDALMALVPGASGCADVTAAQLAAITGRLDLSSQNITALAAGDFAGLTELTQLKLNNNKLTTLPEDVFDGLTSLAVLFLSNNELTTLPDGVFEPLTALQFLDLSGNLGAPFAPIADARTDDGTVPVAGGKVRLDGSGSGGAWGTNVTYGWALTTSTSGVTVTFDDDTSATPVVTIPALAEGAELTFTLTVTGRGGSHSIDPATDTAKVTATDGQ